MKKLTLVSLLLSMALLAGSAYAAPLYFPHVATSIPWQTEIAIINTSPNQITGNLRALSNEGQLIETRAVTLSARGRRQIIIADEFANHTNIGYIIFDADSDTVQGYTKFYQEGTYRAAIPAVKEVNTSDIYISHIASNAQWWTGVSLVNTTSATKQLTITYNNGQSVPYTLNANAHGVFTIQPDVQSAVITNASGIIGLELFGGIGGNDHLDGILLTDKTASTIYYPHVASDNVWWTGIVAYNPSSLASTITITPYSAQGTPLSPSTRPIAGKEKYIGPVSDLSLPAQTAWFRIDSTLPLSGFELFGTLDGSQLAAYAGNGGTGAKAGVFAKIEKNGWTGIAFVNTEDSAASVTLTAYNDNGSAVATQVLPVGGHAKVVNNAVDIFTQDISGATYISYSSDRNVVGFQLNGSSDGTMLDGLPGLAGDGAAQSNIQSINPSQGPITGGTKVTLAGSGFTGTTLTLDGTAVTPTSASDTQIVFQTPTRDNGIASIKLSGNGPNTYAEFLYLPPTLQSLPPGYITTVMGIGLFSGDGRLAIRAMVDAGEPGFAITADGSLLFDEPNNFVIRRLRPDGILERYAGTGLSGTSGDGGPALNALLGHPRGMAIDPAGNLLFVDTGVTNCIRRIDANTGIITTLYGGKSAGFSGDGGSAVTAQFNEPIRIAFDGLGNLYVLDWGNVRIRKIDTLGTITTIAGTGTIGFSGDGGPATQATFDVIFRDLGDLAADTQGNVYLADTANNRVRRIDGRTGIITTFAADVGQVRAVVTDGVDNVYIGVMGNASSAGNILKLSPTGQLLHSWGKGIGISADEADAATTPMCEISRLALDRSGNVILGDSCSYRFQRINVSTGRLETIAGSGSHIIGEAGPALTTVLVAPGTELLFLASGDLLIGESGNHRIRKMDQQGNLSNFAGSGVPWGAWEGAALQTYMPAFGLAQTPTGDIIVAQGSVGTARIDSSGNVHSLTDGNQRFTYGFSGDGGPAISATTDQPYDVAADSAGNIYIADSNNNRIRRIDARTGIINTVAGSGPGNGYEHHGNGSYCGDGGPATQACLNTPYGIAVAPDGTMFIGENNQRIRKVNPEGIISTLFSGGGSRVRLSSSGNLFMGPLRIQPNGHAYWLLSGNSASGLGDGGPASQAKFGGGNLDSGVAVDSEGNLFFSDPWIGRVRAIRFGAVMAEPGSTVAFSSGNSQTTAIGTAFPMVLQVTLKSPEGTLEKGIRVDFAAPTSGASCTFPGGSSTYSTLTNIAGQASATCTANSQLGSYSVTATPLALGQSVSFSLTNTIQ